MRRGLLLAAALMAALVPISVRAATAPKRTGPTARCLALAQQVNDAARAIAFAQVQPTGADGAPSKRQQDRQAAAMQSPLRNAVSRYRSGGCGALTGSAAPADYLAPARRCVAETARETGEMEAKFNDQFKNLPHAAPDPPLDPSLCVQSNWKPEPAAGSVAAPAR